MKYLLDEYVQSYFRFLTEDYNFIESVSVSDGQAFQVEFCSKAVNVKIEKYRREIYVNLYKPSNPNNEMNLFVLLQFLHEKTDRKTIASNYFSDVNDIGECFRLQIQDVATALKSNIDDIMSFFLSEDFENKIYDVNRFVIDHHPELFPKEKGKGGKKKSVL